MLCFRDKKGYSLAELVAVSSIMLILTGFVISSIPERLQIARTQALKSNLATIRQALDDYYSDHGKYPASLLELTRENNGGYRYLARIPKDPLTNLADWQLIIEEESDLLNWDFESENIGDTLEDYDGHFIPPYESDGDINLGRIVEDDFMTGTRSLLIEKGRWCRLEVDKIPLTLETRLILWAKLDISGEILGIGFGDSENDLEYCYQLGGQKNCGHDEEKAYFSNKHRISSWDNSGGWRRFIIHIGGDILSKFDQFNIDRLYFFCHDPISKGGAIYIDSFKIYNVSRRLAQGGERVDAIVDIKSSAPYSGNL